MPSNDPIIAPLGWLVLAFGSALLDGGRERRLAAAGLSCLGLGLAAWRATSPDPGGPLPSPDRLGAGFLVVNGGLLLLGLGLVIRAACLGSVGRRQVVPMLAIVPGVILIAGLSAESLLAAGLGRVVASAGALGLGGAVLLMVGRTVASSRPARALGRGLFAPPLRPSLPRTSTARWAAGGLAASTAATALGPHVAIVFLGVMLTAWSAFFLSHPRIGRPAPVTPVLALLLVPCYWLLATIAGPEGLGISALPLVPLSPAAEWLVAPVLLLVSWSVAGLWPLHRQVPGALSGPAGALLLIRIALPLASGGLEYWRPLIIPLVVIGMWHAAARARWPLLAMGAAFLGTAGLTPAGVIGAGWLIGSALVLEMSSMASLTARVVRVVQMGAWVSAVWGGLLVLEGGLRGEVVYTALGTAGLALLMVSWNHQAKTASAPRRSRYFTTSA